MVKVAVNEISATWPPPYIIRRPFPAAALTEDGIGRVARIVRLVGCRMVIEPGWDRM